MSSLPKLRLSEFSDSDTYCSHKFDDIFSFSSGKNIKQNESSPEFSTPCVRYGELYHMYGEVITRTINNTNLEHSELTFSAGNEILLPSAGEDPLDIGSASALTLEGVAIGRTINVLRPKGTIDYSHIYVSYYINEKLRKRISQLARGASISNVYNSDLKTLKACLPSFPEQQKIASFLSKVDEKITLLTEKKAKLTEYKKGVMQQLFDGSFQEQDGKLVFVPPPLRFKADDGSDFPDWRERKIGEFGTFYYGKSAPKWSVTKDASVPCVRYGELYSKYQGTVDKIYSYTSIPKDKLKFSKGGEVLVPRVGEDPLDFAKCSYLPLENVAIGEMISVFNSKEDGQFMATYFRATCKNKFARLVEGGNVSNLYFRYLEHVVICIPHKTEQIKIVNFLTTIDKKIELANTELEKAKEWKKGLLQQMFV